jgi:hypothetical protein
MHKLAALAAATLLHACNVVAPPPIVAAHSLAQPNPEGTTTVSLVAGLGGGIFIEDGLGVELRVAHQISDRVELGAGLTVGRISESNSERRHNAHERYLMCKRHKAEHHDQVSFLDLGCDEEVPVFPEWLVALRGFARLTPDLDHGFYAATFGVGAGLADSGLRYLTLDAGARISSGNGTADFYAQPTLALSIPVARGRAIDDGKSPRTTFFWGGSLGTVGNSDGAYQGSLDLSFLKGYSAADSAFLMMISGAGLYSDRD